MRQILSSISLLAVSLAAPAVQAQSIDEYLNLGRIVLLGGLTPVAEADFGRSVTVLTADEIEGRGITTVQQALQAVPGVAISGSGESLAQVRIRGAEANHTLILIDGIEAAGGDGDYYLSGLEAANIERIEVLRGPQSVVYGSAASAGVINIVTRRAVEGRTLDFTVQTGDASVASAFMGWRNDRGGVSLSLSHLNDRGYDQSGDGGERDGITRSSAILSADYALSDDFSVDVTLRRSREHSEYDLENYGATDADSFVVDDPSLYNDRAETTAALGLTYAMMDGRLTHRLSYASTRDSRTNTGAPPEDTQTDALRYRLSFGLDGQPAEVADQLLNVMAEWQRDSSSVNAAYFRETRSYAMEYRGRFGDLSVQAGARFDDNLVFEDVSTWTLALSYDFADSGYRLHASAGTGVVNPSYFELYADAWGTVGNPNLQPERNRSFDLGLEIPLAGDRGSLDVTYFREVMTNEIIWVPTGPGTYTYANETGESPRQGIELAGRMQVTDALSVRLAYTYLDATNPDGTVEVRRPQHELTLGATMATFGGRGSVSADIRHVAGNWDTQFWPWPSPTLELPSYTTVDLSAQYAMNDRVMLIGRVSNLFDADTMDVWGYHNRGRAVYVGLQARF